MLTVTADLVVKLADLGETRLIGDDAAGSLDQRDMPV